MNQLSLSQVIQDINWHLKESNDPTQETLKLWKRSLDYVKLNEQPYRAPEGPRHDMGQ